MEVEEYMLNRSDLFDMRYFVEAAVAVDKPRKQVTRISVERTDPSYHLWLSGVNMGAKVFLDGVEQDLVVTADSEMGFVKRARMRDGNFVKVDEEVVWGKVRIELL